MLIEPPIDRMIDKAGCSYLLVCGVSKRARDIITQRPDLINIQTGDKPLTIAAKEYWDDKYSIVEHKK